MNSGNNNGFKVKDTNTQSTIGERLGGGVPIIDRSVEDFSKDILGRHSPFADITFEECDDLIAAAFLMSGFDTKVTADLLVCSMAVFCRDISSDPEIREHAAKDLLAAFFVAFGEYDRRMGATHHDFRDCLESIPSVILDDLLGDDSDCDGCPDGSECGGCGGCGRCGGGC